MYRPDKPRPYTQGDPEMYEESRYRHDQRRTSPPRDRNLRQDYHRVSHHGHTDMTDLPYHQQFNDHAPQYDDQREHSRSPRPSKRRYTDRDREDYHSPTRGRSRSPDHGNPPNKTVVLEGLPVNATKEDIKHELENTFQVEQLEEVRLIHDKVTGQSRRFAFAQFTNIEKAKAFVDANAPTIAFTASCDPSNTDSDFQTVRISYSRGRGDRDERKKPGDDEDDWKCEVCYLMNYSQRQFCHRCNGPRTRNMLTSIVGIAAHQNMSIFSGFATTGDSDVSPDGTASQFLLFRGLESSVTEEMLSKGASKLYKSKIEPVGAPVQKGSKIQSTKANDATLGAKEGSLQRVLLIRDRQTNESWKFGFAEFGSVEDAQAAMAKYNVMEKFTIASKSVMVSYIHAGVFVPVLQAPAPEYEKFVFSPLHNHAINLMYWDEAGFANILAMEKPKLSALEAAKERLAAKKAAVAAGDGLTKDSDTRTKKRKPEKETTSASKKVIAPHLQFWSNRHAELHGLPSKSQEADLETMSTPETIPDEEVLPSQSFADLQRKCCLLCSRQFKTDTEVYKHERGSQLHRDNMKKEGLVAKALIKLAKIGAVQPSADETESAYRDRAKERRQAFNQPKQPAAQHGKPHREVEPLPKEEAKPIAPSKGAALLGKMGWTAGTGLGAQGTGRTEAISTDLYAQGVGLGAEGGKVGDAIVEANKATNGSYSDFVQKAKDKAKERYQKM